MNQILYAGKQRVKEWVIIMFVTLLWIFSISLTFNGVYSAINESKYMFKKKENIIIKIENTENPVNNIEPPISNPEPPPSEPENPSVGTEEPGYIIEGPGGSDVVDSSQNGGIVISDMTKPTITVSKTQSNKLRVIARDNKGLQYITYKWNEGTENKIEISSGRAVLIAIPVGKNTITITACDLSGNIETYTGTYTVDTNSNGSAGDQNSDSSKDTLKPRIYFGKGNPISITIIDDSQLSSVTYLLNGNVQNVSLSSATKSISFKLSLPSGANELVITATDKYGNKEEISRTINI